MSTVAQIGTALVAPEVTRPSTIAPMPTWMGENSLLSCFTNPTTAARVGYKHATGCLRSKVCKECGTMCCTAHPFTLRVCQQCAMMNRVCWTIAEFRAKQAFLLSKQDINQIPTLSLVIGGVTKTLCWLPNVILLSLNKYGGVDGLQAAFEAKKAMALAKYNMRLLTAKPQKSIPEIGRAHV